MATDRKPSAARPFTGRHAFWMFVAFFGVIMAVNFTMARYASSTFGGIVVKNSYVASQEFNNWLEQAEEQASWGWTVTRSWRDDGRIAVALADVPGVATISATARHPLGRRDDVALTFTQQADGSFVSDAALPADRWIMRLQVEAEGKVWRAEERVQ
jgi:nitrogen fixation protein FixH